MKKTRFAKTKLSFAATAGFIAGMLTMSAIVLVFSESADVRLKANETEVPQTIATPVIGPNIAEDLKQRHLDLPVQGAKPSDVRDTFNEKRGSDRRHEAVDMLAPRNTPVLAVEDGTVAKLFFSKAGGNTIYQFDPSRTYAYYYAHLERYADGLAEGAGITRGQVIGYVGTTGNAPPNTPHLHFAIFRLTEEKQWWKGTAIDPYQVLR